MKNDSSKPRPNAIAFKPREFVAIGTLGFLFLLSYGLLRSPIDAVYLDFFPAKKLPQVWLAVAFAAAFSAWGFARLSARVKFGTLALILSTLLVTTGAFLFLGVGQEKKWCAFGIYVWKDVYIILLIEILWTAANLTIPKDVAKWIYGFFLVFGSVGGMTGNLVASKLGSLGHHKLSVWLALAVVVFSMLWSPWLNSKIIKPKTTTITASIKEVFTGKSFRSIQLLLALIVLVQITTTVIDYAYIQALETHAQTADARTALGGKVYASIEVVAFILQLTSGIAIRFLGSVVPLFMIPTLLLGCIGFSILNPSFAAASITKIANKAMDYSLFRAGKELLYFPLSYQEKTQGKAWVDVFGYRVAKGGASVLLLFTAALPAFGAWSIAAAGVVLWLVCGVFIKLRWNRYEQKNDHPGN